MSLPTIERLPDTTSTLGEGPFFDSAGNRLLWVDIVDRSINIASLTTGVVTRHPTDDRPTAVVPRRNRADAIVSFAGRVSFFDLETGATTPFVVPDPTSGNRLNEAKCDPAGRFWTGSMQTNLNPDGSPRDMDRHSGALFRVDPDGSVTRLTPHEIGVSNTMAWTPDGTFYFADSLKNVIYAYDYDPTAGTIANRRVHLEGGAPGVPDGSCLDADGCLWNARYAGGRLLRITPDGRIDRELVVPVTNPTSCAFGGPGYETLFVTTARTDVSAEALAENPAEGMVLAITGLGRGLPPDEFAG